MATAPICLDGSEGGGQLLRTALTLSLVTQTPFSLQKLAARGPAPGLRPEGLACLRAARAVSGAAVGGAQVGSQELSFEPGPLRPGAYLLEAGTIPQTLQTVAVPLSRCAEGSALTLTGATHLPDAPSLHYLKLIWLPAVHELGYRIDVELCAAGWSAEGGGEVKVQVRPQVRGAAIERRGRGTLRDARVLCAISNVPLERAARQSARAQQRLREGGVLAQVETLPLPAPRSTGSMCLVAASFERGAAGFQAVGAAAEDPEAIGDAAALAFLGFMRGRGAVDEHLADQLLVPAALAAAGLGQGPAVISRFTTPRASERLLATARAVELFLEVEVAILTGPEGEAELRIAPRAESLVAALRAGRAPKP